MTDVSDIGPYFAVNLSVIGSEGSASQYEFKANANQRSALSCRFGCVDIPCFEVRARITPLRKDGQYRVSGVVTARVVQNCVVSLEPLTSDFEQELDLLLLPEMANEDLQIDLEDEEYEFYSVNVVDLGEIGAVEMALAIDPYPRAPGVTISELGPGAGEKGYEVNEEAQLGGNRPFAALAAIKRKG